MSGAPFFFSGPSGPDFGLIKNSLRFRRNGFLTRTHNTNPTSTKICTFSGWVKIVEANNANNFSIVSGEQTQYTQLAFGSSNNIQTALAIQTAQGASVNGRWQGNAEHRDPSAWYHIVMVYNSVPGGSNGIRIWRNGVEQGNLSYIDPNGNDHKFTSNGTVVQVGAFQSTYKMNGYMAELHFVDGQALSPTDFGEYDNNGVWAPKKYTGTYGNNGWYLDFSDPANIGADRSGRGNNFTSQGFELTNTSLPEYDYREDTPTKNSATLNPLLSMGDANLYRANCEAADSNSGGGWIARPATMQLPTSGKVYWEMILGGGTTNCFIGMIDDAGLSNTLDNGTPAQDAGNTFSVRQSDCDPRPTGANTTGPKSGMGYNDVIGFAADCDTGILKIYKNNVLNVQYVTTFNPELGYYPAFFSTAAGTQTHNFRFSGFKYSPPAGFEPLSTANQPDVAITNPSKNFQAILGGASILTSAQSTFPQRAVEDQAAEWFGPPSC